MKIEKSKEFTRSIIQKGEDCVYIGLVRAVVEGHTGVVYRRIREVYIQFYKLI